MLELKDFSKLYQKAQPLEEETFDVRFEKAITLVEQENFQEALPLIQKIFNEGCLDIRLIMYRIFAEFVQKGLISFIDFSPFVVSLFKDHWDKISPIKLREKYSISSLTWFFSALTKKLKRSVELQKEARLDSLWILSENTLDLNTIDTIEEELSLLSLFFNDRWKQANIDEHILYIKQWMTPFKVKSPIVSVKEEPMPDPEQKALLPLKNDLLISKPMKLLIKKLHAFTTLIENNEMTKAALLSDDIRTTLASFNPTIFFPKLFSPYLSLVAKNIAPLLAEWEQKESPQWESLKELYHTDFDEFLKW